MDLLQTVCGLYGFSLKPVQLLCNETLIQPHLTQVSAGLGMRLTLLEP